MRNFYLIICSLLLTFSVRLQAQTAPQLQWAISPTNEFPMGGYIRGNDVATDAAGNRYVTGQFTNTADFTSGVGTSYYTSRGSMDCYIAKFSSSGTTLWVAQLGGTGTNTTIGNAIALDTGGNVIVTGTFRGTTDFNGAAAVDSFLTSSGNGDAFIVKYDANGNYMWAKSISGASETVANDIAPDALGNFVITGRFVGDTDFDTGAGVALQTTSGSINTFIAKYNTNGDYVWAKSFGGAFEDIGTSVAIDASNNVLVTGTFQDVADFNPAPAVANLTASGLRSVFIARYDLNGTYSWAKALIGNTDIAAQELGVDSAGNVYVTGQFEGTVDFDPADPTFNLSSAGATDLYLVKLTTAGVYSWAKRIGGTNYDEGRGIAFDAAQNIYITGYFMDTVDFDAGAGIYNMSTTGLDAFMAKYTNAGVFSLAREIGVTGSSYGTALSIRSDVVSMTGYFSGTIDLDTGAATANFTSQGDNMFLGRYSNTFVYSSGLSAGDLSQQGKNDIVTDMVLDNNGNTYVTGVFNSTTDFDAGPGTVNLTSQAMDVFLAKYNTSGALVWVKSIGGIENDYGYGISRDTNGNIYLIGNFRGTADFDGGSGMSILTANGQDDIYIAKYDSDGNYIWAKQIGATADEESGMDIAIDANNNIYATGYFRGTTDFDPSGATTTLTAAGIHNVFLAKYDTDGNYQWAKSVVGNQAGMANSLAVDSVGNVIITGQFYGTADFDMNAGTTNLTSQGQEDIFLAKYDTNGNYGWAVSIGNGANSGGRAVAVDSADNIVVSGYADNITDFDPSTGTDIIPGIGNYDVFLSKFNATGAYLWTKRLGGTSSEEALSLKVDTNDNIIIGGHFYGPVDFDPSGATATLTPSDTDGFIAKYDNNGNYIWAGNIGGSGYDAVRAMAVNSLEDVYVGGTFFGTADFDITTTGNYNITGLNSMELYVAKYSQCIASSAPILLADTTSICAGGTATITASGDLNSGIGWQFYEGSCGSATNLGTATTLSVSPTVTTTYYVRGEGGCAPLGPCSSITIVVGDSVAPVAPTLSDVTGQCSATLTAPTANDACAGTITGTTTTTFPITSQGTTVVTWSFNDGNGNISTATQNVVIADTTAPSVPTLSDVTGQCSATLTAPTANDACAGTITGTTTTTFPITSQGTTVVTWSFNDGNGNISTATQNVIIADTTAPSAPTLSDVTGQCSATLTAPTANDACAGTITGTTTTTFPIASQGTTVVTWSFNDGNGNIITATQNVIIADTTAPSAPTLSDVTGQCSATLTAPTANDACSGTITGTTTTTFPITSQGTTVVTWSFNDGNGNISTATQNVIIADTTAPSAPTLSDVTGQCSATLTAPTANDACAGTITGTTTTTFPITSQGTTVVTWSFNDGNGNISTATQNVILNNTTDTTISVSGATLTANQAGASYQWLDCNNSNQPISLANGQSFTPAVDGNYAVIITLNGCDSTSACTAVLDTKDNNFSQDIKLYPNPTNGNFKIDFPGTFGEVHIAVVDVLGKLVQYRTFRQEQQIMISLENAASGVYLVQLQADEQTAVFKVIKN